MARTREGVVAGMRESIPPAEREAFDRRIEAMEQKREAAAKERLYTVHLAGWLAIAGMAAYPRDPPPMFYQLAEVRVRRKEQERLQTLELARYDEGGDSFPIVVD